MAFMYFPIIVLKPFTNMFLGPPKWGPRLNKILFQDAHALRGDHCGWLFWFRNKERMVCGDNHDHKYSYYSNYDSWEWLVVLVPYLL